MVQSVLILNATSLYEFIGPGIFNSCKKWLVSEDEFEAAYDWCITEALRQATQQKISNHISINNHFKHDIYRCVFEEHTYILIEALKRLLKINGIILNSRRPIKMMVTFSEIIIVHKPFE